LDDGGELKEMDDLMHQWNGDGRRWW